MENNLIGKHPSMLKIRELITMVSDTAEKGVVKAETSFGLDALRSLKALKAEATKHIEQKAIMYALNMTGWNKR